MVDIWSKEKRSLVMSKIKGKDTLPERLLRSLLHKKGFRFRKNVKRLPGKPDIVLPKYRLVIFVHGCFWHLHKNCYDGRIPKSNISYWKFKLQANVKRDKNNVQLLKKAGWKVIRFWECEIEKSEQKTIEKINKIAPK
jgi:DNA mismatch endonuclease, patch repair protein